MKEELLKIAQESLSSDEVSKIVKEKFMNALGGAIEDAFRWGDAKHAIEESGTTKSCGCLEKEVKATMHLKHGMAKSRLWNIWTGMRDRCSRSNNKDYQRYGGRGIRVCPEWDSDFRNFYDWSMGNGYSDELTIDRIDNDGNYEPSNCRWVTRKEQTRNRSITKTIPLARIAEIDGITYQEAYKKYVLCK